jgi:hypothetical protein
MEKTLTFTGHYEDRGAPRIITHSVRIKDGSDKEINTAVNQLMFQIGNVGMIDREGEKWTLFPGHRFDRIECQVSALTLATGTVVIA